MWLSSGSTPPYPFADGLARGVSRAARGAGERAVWMVPLNQHRSLRQGRVAPLSTQPPVLRFTDRGRWEPPPLPSGLGGVRSLGGGAWFS